jgi:hypothetical protein
MEIGPALNPGSKGMDEQSAHKAPVVTAIEIAHDEREAKAPGPPERAITSQPARLVSHEAHSARFLKSNMRLFLFDGFVLHENEQDVALPPQAQRLIAFVTLRRTVSRDEVRCALWPDISDDRASARLRTTLWRLREPGRSVLNATNGQLSLAEDVDVTSGTDGACLPGH